MKTTLLIADTHTQFWREHTASSLTDRYQTNVKCVSGLVDFFTELNRFPVPTAVIVNPGLASDSVEQLLKKIREKAGNITVFLCGDQHDLIGMLPHLSLDKAKDAQGLVTRQTSLAVILSAIFMVQSGELFIPSQLIRGLLQEDILVDDAQDSVFDLLSLHLTPRQKEVLHLIVEGHRNKEICNRLNMSMGTIKSHCNAIFRFLNVSNRTQAASAARRMQLV